jgi:A/G-specific adenine glycosylase
MKMKSSEKDQDRERAELRARLIEKLRLFSAEKRRSLPWRKNQTSYRVLVSELMLQQTQVKRVEEKYEPFLKEFPSLKKVRAANLSSLLLAWKGLGYMRRVKALKSIGDSDLVLPETREELLALPGIGEYTSGAIMAFAYNRFVPILETNIKTVLCHHFCNKDKSVCFSDNQYKEMLSILFKETKLSARSFYESFMDYGAFLKGEKVLVCKLKVKQKKFKGSKRELRAKALYNIVEKRKISFDDTRMETVLEELLQEGFIEKTSTGYVIAP